MQQAQEEQDRKPRQVVVRVQAHRRHPPGYRGQQASLGHPVPADHAGFGKPVEVMVRVGKGNEALDAQADGHVHGETAARLPQQVEYLGVDQAQLTLRVDALNVRADGIPQVVAPEQKQAHAARREGRHRQVPRKAAPPQGTRQQEQPRKQPHVHQRGNEYRHPHQRRVGVPRSHRQPQAHGDAEQAHPGAGHEHDHAGNHQRGDHQVVGAGRNELVTRLRQRHAPAGEQVGQREQENEAAQPGQQPEVPLARHEVVAFVQPVDLGEVMQRAEYGVGEQEHFERQKDRQPERQPHEGHVEVVDCVGIHPAA